MQYVQDSDERTPLVYAGTNSVTAASVNTATTAIDANPSYWKWMDCMYPYVKSAQVYTCPSDSRAASLRNYVPRDSLTGGATTASYGSYTANAGYYNLGDGMTPPFSNGYSGFVDIVNLSQFNDSSNTVLLLENDANNTYCRHQFLETTAVLKTYITQTSPRFMTDNSIYNIPERHLDTTNVLFADGHVKALKLDSLIEAATGSVNTGYPKRFTIEAD